MSTNHFEIAVLGETMIRFTPPDFNRLEQTTSLQMHVGGSESNTAVGLARLGHRVAWISRLTNNPLGRLIVQSLAFHGVDVSHVCWTEDDRVGTYYMERGTPPRGSSVFYDRGDSAMSKMQPGDLGEELFTAGSIQLFHTTGITLGISDVAARTALQAAKLAKSAGAKLSFDVNYRAKLWSSSQARKGMSSLIELADIIFLPHRDAELLFGVAGCDASAALRQLHQLWPQATVVMTRGGEGSAGIGEDGKCWEQPAFRTGEVERLGGGDAFASGFLSAYLRNYGISEALRWGNAVAALKYTIPGDLPLIDRPMVERLLSEPYSGLQR